MRIHDVSVPLSHFFSIYLPGLHCLTEQVLNLPEMQTITRECAIVAGLVNDLLSLPKDVRSEPDTLSIVPLLGAERGCQAQTAVDEVTKMIKESFARFKKTERDLAVLELDGLCVSRAVDTGAIRKDIEAFVQAGKDLVMGSIRWSYDTPRYMKGGEAMADGSVVFELGR